MTLFIFAVLLSGALVLFLFSFAVDKKKQKKDSLLRSFTGITDWRKRLNGLTDRFVLLGNEPLLVRAASTSNDPALTKLKGQTLTLYRQLKEHFIALSYAYNCSSRAVQQVESLFKPKGALKLVNIRRAVKLSEQGLTIKEVTPQRFTKFLTPAKYAPKPPNYQLEFVLSVSDKLAAEITAGLKTIAETPAKVQARLTNAEKNLAAVGAQNTALLAAGVTYLPYDQRVQGITSLLGRVSSSLESDPLGSLALCNELDSAIQALTQELNQAKQQLAAVNDAQAKLAETRAWVEKVRATVVTCPWTETEGEPACWTLSTTDSNPDSQLHQAATLLNQAQQSLANGQLPAVAGECKQALAARAEAEKMVKAQLESKTRVDEQVPRVRAELAAIHSQLVGITGGDSTHEMAQLVDHTCKAVEGRIKEVHNLYQQQLFPGANSLLTGTTGSEYGMPIAKLVDQAKELLQLLKKAAQVANSLKLQTA